MLSVRADSQRLMAGLVGLVVLAAAVVLTVEWQRGTVRAVAEASRVLEDRADDVAEHLERDLVERSRAVRAWVALDVAQELAVDDVDKRLAATLRELARDLGAEDLAIAVDTAGRVVAASDSSIIGRQVSAVLPGVRELNGAGVMTAQNGSRWFGFAQAVVTHDGRAIGQLALLAPWSRLANSGLAPSTVARLRVESDAGVLFVGREMEAANDYVVGRATRTPLPGLTLAVALGEPRRQVLAPVRAARRFALLSAAAVLLALVPVAILLARAGARALARQEALRSMGAMAAGLAHEIRTPLGVVRTSLDLLARGGDEERRGELTQIVREEASRLERLVDDLLAFARPGVPVLVREDLEAVIRAASPILESVCERHGARLELETVSAPAMIDAAQLRQVLLNLVDNGARAAGTNGRVYISTRAERDGARLDIRDTGPGVPVELRQTLWEPFVTSRSTGTGLGLSIVRRIVDAHGARIVLVEHSGAGAHFRITFPAL